jgi:hypothetical protein
MNTRTLQDILRIEQIRLASTKHPLMRRVIKDRIVRIAGELLYRWKAGNKGV